MNHVRKLLAATAMAFFFFISSLYLYESIVMAFFADQAMIDGYHFGSEAMVGHGGFPYRSYHYYLWYGFGISILMIAMIYFLWRDLHETPFLPFWVVALGSVGLILTIFAPYH